MSLGLLLVNVVSVSSSLGALTALVVLYVHLRSRGVLLLAVSVLLLTADYVLGLVMFASPGSPLWLGQSGLPLLSHRDAILLGIKGILQVGVLVTAPLAVLSLFGRTPGPVTLGAGSVIAAAALAASVCVLGGFFPGALGALSPVIAVPEYAAFASIFVTLMANRGAMRPGLSRGIVRATLIALIVCVPLLLANDVMSFVGVGPYLLPSDAMGFLVLSGGVLVCSLLVLLGGRRVPAPVEIDAFCGEHGLSVREREVLVLLAGGLRYKQIADKLCISMDTVKSHASRIYRKTEASGRTDLLYRMRLGRL